jgi:RNA polymerase sigma factor (sigma-70 family)
LVCVSRLQQVIPSLSAAMTVTYNPTPAIHDPIASHRYVRPIVREISPVAAAPRDILQTSTAPKAAAAWTDAGELERVVRAAAAGDEMAVVQLVNRFAARIRAAARAHRLPDHDVEDVMQTTWLRLVQRIDTIQNPSAIGAWLETTARRESLRILKTNNRECPTDDLAVFDGPAPPMAEPSLPSPERCAAALTAALEQLTGHQRRLISTLFSDPVPHYGDVSRELGMPIGSIGPTRARALKRLRKNRDLRSLAPEGLLDTL